MSDSGTSSRAASLKAVDLHAHYPDGTMALKGATLAAAPGQRVALLGASGSGKTSLMLAIMGGLPLQRGRVFVDDIETGPRRLDEIRRRCGMVFQEADDQLFMPTLLEDAAFGPLNHGVEPERAVEDAQIALADVGLKGLEQRGGHHLSGGQKRAASLATVLSMRVGLLLLDEPTANLDARSRSRLAALLRGRTETMLVATHDLAFARAVCERAVIISEGRAAAAGASAEILADEALLRRHGLVSDL